MTAGAALAALFSSASAWAAEEVGRCLLGWWDVPETVKSEMRLQTGMG